jgi:hypothetical protein
MRLRLFPVVGFTKFYKSKLLKIMFVYSGEPFFNVLLATSLF